MFEKETRTVDLHHWIQVILITCIAMQILFILADYIINYKDIFNSADLRNIWNIAREMSIPTWFASLQAQLLAATVFLIALVQARSLSRLKLCGWLFIGMFFLWIGIDDFAELHERLSRVLVHVATEKYEQSGGVIGVLLQNPSFPWHAFIGPIFALCGVMILAFLWISFWQLHLTRYLIIGFGCWAVSQGIDFVEGLKNIEHVYVRIENVFAVERDYTVPHYFKVVEETLEMLGTTVLWIGFLQYFVHVASGLKVQFVERSSPLPLPARGKVRLCRPGIRYRRGRQQRKPRRSGNVLGEAQHG